MAGCKLRDIKKMDMGGVKVQGRSRQYPPNY